MLQGYVGFPLDLMKVRKILEIRGNEMKKGLQRFYGGFRWPL